ncbi:hypothetical protein CROQUDRAFT_111294 [Cronartium quercuum f. sp. fusiforme G11]|uniref:Uncharacterized protein n=1 Tax=Cronartium quercuum f. sp. fusiforme G11 TaxID=708437 RepID=A0A9P6N613_9BASI|nr:hypothetical protein CROQUDRAFT_111294 [Cronartium quercuum f. sp. fusiforme G11]
MNSQILCWDEGLGVKIKSDDHQPLDRLNCSIQHPLQILTSHPPSQPKSAPSSSDPTSHLGIPSPHSKPPTPVVGVPVLHPISQTALHDPLSNHPPQCIGLVENTTWVWREGFKKSREIT